MKIERNIKKIKDVGFKIILVKFTLLKNIFVPLLKTITLLKSER